METERFDREVKMGVTPDMPDVNKTQMNYQVMEILDLESSIAQYGLVMVRYRSAQEAIDFIIEPEFGLYRHPFIGFMKQSKDIEAGHTEEVCYLCN